MSDNKLQLTIVTPEAKVYEGEADSVVVPAHEGYMGILPSHLPVLALTKPGMVEVLEGNSTLTFFVSGGYFELHKDKILLLVRASEPATAIDTERAREALERAEQKIKDELGLTRAERLVLERARQRAQARIDMADTRGNM